MLTTYWATRLLWRGIRESRWWLAAAGAAGVWWRIRARRRSRRGPAAVFPLRPGQSALLRVRRNPVQNR